MRSASLLFLLAVVAFSPFLVAQDAVFPETLIEEEKAFLLEHYGKPGEGLKSAWSNYLHSKILKIREQKWKPSTKVNFALPEFGRVEGVCFAWKYDFASLKDLIKEVSLDSKAYIAVGKEHEKSVFFSLQQHGCKMENVEFCSIESNTIWVQDYGPFFVATSNGQREVVDLVYNRPRPKDDDFPNRIASIYKWPVRKSSLVLPGGNVIFDGFGAAILTDAVFDPNHGGDPSLTMDLLKLQMKEIFNCHEVHVLKAMKKDGTGHIDMFCKLLDTQNAIVGEYQKREDAINGNYEILNENAEKLARLHNGKGERFIVHRVPMPAYNMATLTYTNSLIVNEKVLVPIYGCKEDEAALKIYRKILPHARVIGFDCNEIIGLNGAIHCMTKPVLGIPPANSLQSMSPIGQEEMPRNNLKKSQHESVIKIKRFHKD